MFSQEPYHRPPTKKGPETLTFHALLFPLLRSAPIASSLRSVSSVFSSTREFHLCPAPEVASGCLHVARCREDQSPRRLALCLAWNSQGKVKASDGFPAVLGTRGGWAHIGWRPARQELPKVEASSSGVFEKATREQRPEGNQLFRNSAGRRDLRESDIPNKQIRSPGVERTPQGMTPASRSACRWALLLLAVLWPQVMSHVLSAPSRSAPGLRPGPG